MQFEIIVGTEAKALVENKAKAVCKTLGLGNDKFNQDMNAYAICSSLVEAGVTIPEEKKKLVMQILKKGGNASALRQAITAKAETEVSTKLAEELMSL